MCGILFSNNKNNIKDLSLLQRRGPESNQEIENHLGYFYHSNLNTIGELTQQPLNTGNGFLLYNGSTYNHLPYNDARYIADNLNDNVDHTIEIIKSLRGEYALIYVTDNHIVFCADHFYQRNLYYYHDTSGSTTICTIPKLVQEKHNSAWRAEPNFIYIVDKQNNKIKKIINKSWNFHQKDDNFDKVFSCFEKAVKDRFNPMISTTLQSSGLDSGVVNAAVYKMYGDNFKSVCDIKIEDKQILNERNKLHRTYPVIHSGSQTEKALLENKILGTDIWDMAETDPMLYIVREVVKKMNSHKIILTGTGGDEIYNDYQGQRNNRKTSISNGAWPEDLSMIWPWHSYTPRLTHSLSLFDYVCGLYGVETRNPLLDSDLVQAWLNTTCKLKNKAYKGWMQEYCKTVGYPYTLEKIHFNEP